MKNRRQSQMHKIWKYLERGRRITPLQALNMVGSLSLGARIYDLRKIGIDIETEMIDVGGKRVARYKLAK